MKEGLNAGNFEIERKYLIEYPDCNMLLSKDGCRRLDITQTYLAPVGETERRIRLVRESDEIRYYKTEKTPVNGLKRREKETLIGCGEYRAILKAEKHPRVLSKTRYSIPFDGHVIEIDIYPFWNDRAIAETEMSSEMETVALPPFIKVIKEVTGDPQYKNSSLAREE